jgi:hypothetical protein
MNGTGIELVKVAVPLVTGVSLHRGLAAHLLGSDEEAAVAIATSDYETYVVGRGFEIDQLEAESFVFQEQRALVEALVRLGVRRVIPRLKEIYDVLEVERLDKRLLYEDDTVSITWRSVTDALLRKKDDGDLYLLSWKSCAEVPTDSDARIDMQGVSEAWAIQERLEQLWTSAQWVKTNVVSEADQELRFKLHPSMNAVKDLEAPPRIRGVQMGFFVKGMRRPASKEMKASELTPEQLAGGYKLTRHHSPLIYGYADSSSMMIPAPMTWTREYRCVAPHSMRKSKWYPTGMCDVVGKTHRRGDEWVAFPVWKQHGGVRAWMDLLEIGLDPAAGDPLEFSWALPVPNFRTVEQGRDWFEQTRSREARIGHDLVPVKELEGLISQRPEDVELREQLRTVLNESFPQTTDVCNHWFGRNCPAVGICWGPEHVSSDPIGSGLFQVKTMLVEPIGEEEVV